MIKTGFSLTKPADLDPTGKYTGNSLLEQSMEATLNRGLTRHHLYSEDIPEQQQRQPADEKTQKHLTDLLLGTAFADKYPKDGILVGDGRSFYCLYQEKWYPLTGREYGVLCIATRETDLNFSFILKQNFLDSQ